MIDECNGPYIDKPVTMKGWGRWLQRLYKEFPQDGPASPRVKFLLLSYAKFDNDEQKTLNWIATCSQEEFDKLKLLVVLIGLDDDIDEGWYGFKDA